MAESIVIQEVSDVEPLCRSRCTRAAQVTFAGAGTRALEGMRGFTEVSYLSVGNDEGGSENLRGFETLERIDLLDITGDNSLVSLEGLTNLRHLGDPEDDTDAPSGLTIKDSDLTSLEGMNSLETIRWLEIRNAPVESLEPIEGVEIIDGFGITSTRIETFDGPLIDGPEFRGVNLAQNGELKAIPALSGVRHVTGGINIQFNPNLSRCDIDAFVDGLQTRPEERWIRISGNKPCP